MARTFLRQDTQVRSSDVYTDNVAPSEANFETNPANIESDLNNIRSQLHNLLKVQAGNWWDDISVPSTLEAGTQRGVDDLNDALHLVEKKRVLRCVWGLNSISIAAPGDTFDILGTGELPGNTTAAVGAVTTLGTVVAAHGGTFGTHALSEVAGSTAISPKNLVMIVDAVTRDPILDAGDKVYGLLQGESGLTDGATITDTTTTRVQISFVKINGSGDDLIAISSGAMDGVSYDYCYVERVRLEDLSEQDFLGGAEIDVPTGSTVTRQGGYDNQGATPVNLTTNATLDLEGAGVVWSIRDDLEAVLFSLTEGSAGGTSTFLVGADVDVFDVDAVSNDFLNGVSVDTGAAGTTINLGVTANQIDSGGSLSILSGGAGDLSLAAALELNLTDSYRSGSTWSLVDGIALANSSQEWSDFETAFGEVSLLSAITTAKTDADFDKTCANVTSTTVADTDVGGVAGGTNLDAQIHDLSGGDFLTDHDVYLNGQLLRGGVDAAANNDYYPGTSLANGQLRFEFTVKINDVLCVISRG
jgi:hypothetical protein